MDATVMLGLMAAHMSPYSFLIEKLQESIEKYNILQNKESLDEIIATALIITMKARIGDDFEEAIESLENVERSVNFTKLSQQ